MRYTDHGEQLQFPFARTPSSTDRPPISRTQAIALHPQSAQSTLQYKVTGQDTEETDMPKKLLLLIVAVVVAYGGVTLSRFADADDAPGGVVIGWLIVAVAVGIGVKAVLPTSSTDRAS